MTDTTTVTKTCRDCKAEVPASAKKCAHCGTEFSSRARERLVFVAVALVVALGAGGWMYQKQMDSIGQSARDYSDCIRADNC